MLIGHWIGAHGGVAILASLLAGLARLPRPRVSRSGCSFAAARASPPTSACCSALDWRAAVAFCAIWLLVAVLTRYSSLSALVAALVAPVGLFAIGDHATALLAALMSALLIYKHRANIRRLAAGEEPRIGAKA